MVLKKSLVLMLSKMKRDQRHSSSRNGHVDLNLVFLRLARSWSYENLFPLTVPIPLVDLSARDLSALSNRFDIRATPVCISFEGLFKHAQLLNGETFSLLLFL